MWYLLLAILILGCFAALVGHLNKRNQQQTTATEGAPPVEAATEPSELCCGEHDSCDRELMMEAAVQAATYFDDEELDGYRNRSSDNYSFEEIDLFREVLYTLREEEIGEWLRSLQLREVQLPDMLKDEAYMLVEEQRLAK